MFNRTSKTAGRGKTGRAAFTLLELLVVMSIITILVGILLPAFAQIRIAVYNARSKARVTELGMGAVNYAADHKGLFPGQHYPGRIMKSRFPSDAWAQVQATGELWFTGSTILGVSLFGTNYIMVDQTDVVGFRPVYASCSISDIARIKNFNGSVWDRYPPITPAALPDKMDPWNAVAYWPSTRGVAGLGQYREVQNWWYTDQLSSNYAADKTSDALAAGTFCNVLNWGNMKSPPENPELPATLPYIRSSSTAAQTAFEAFIKDKSLGGNDSNTPVADQRFIMMAAGVDRLFGTKDDITCPVLGNWAPGN